MRHDFPSLSDGDLPMRARVNVFLVLLLSLIAEQTAFGQDVEVRNTKASVSDSLVIVTYGLVGQEGKKYNVALSISTGGNGTFQAKAVSGSVGGGVRAGDGLRWLQIRWRYRKRFPDGLPKEVSYKVVAREEQNPAATSEDLGVRNVTASRADSLVTVTYDLFGEVGKEYQVTLLISASGGETFDYEPKAVSGDVGKKMTPGTGKQIRWRYLEDFPEGLQRDIKYKVQVQEKNGNGWLYALGSALVVGGGATVAAFLTGIIGGDSGGGYPSPPAPPSGN